MFEKQILCSECGKAYPLKTKIFRCQNCKGSLEVVFDYKKLKKALSLERIKSRPFNHNRYLEFYPVQSPVSIQEGGTPLLRSRNIKPGFFDLYFKYEAVNPTGSFKDRGSSVEIAKALEFRAKRVACASTGNMGASLAAYSGLAGLNCSIFTPRDALPTKLEQILAYGARVYHVRGNYSQTAKLVEHAWKKFRVYLLGDYLYRREGTKSVGFEISEQLSPDYVFCPIGNGTLVSAVWKAFKEFNTLGFTKQKPKIVGIQAAGCPPVAKAFKQNKKIKPVKNPKTLAVAIECGDPLDGTRALSAIKESGGFCETVTDSEILKARETLARKEGLFAEPAGAVSLAGALKFKDRIPRGSKVVCLITGHGLKTPKTGVRGKPKEISRDLKSLDKIF